MLQPLYNNLLIRMDVFKEKTEGGIIIPKDAMASDSPIATVMSVGSGVRDVYVGDRVVVPLDPRNRGTPVNMGGSTCYIIPLDSVIAVLK